jgi:3-oxoacyl-[acyl-carrier protein] reductase
METRDGSERVVVVTGGTSGIGEAIAQAFLEIGDSVVLLARNAERLSAAAAALQAEFPSSVIDTCECDIRDAQNVEDSFARIHDAHGALDVLVNNAGANSRTKVDSYTSIEWSEEMDTNLTGSFNCSMSAFRRMKNRRSGWIVNISSIKGKEATSSVGYGASKAGVIGLTRSMAKQFISHGIYVNCVAPGFIDTGMSKLLSPSERDSYMKLIPIQRMGDEREVAQVVRFLTGPEASYIVGATIDVNGGYLMS